MLNFCDAISDARSDATSDATSDAMRRAMRRAMWRAMRWAICGVHRCNICFRGYKSVAILLHYECILCIEDTSTRSHIAISCDQDNSFPSSRRRSGIVHWALQRHAWYRVLVRGSTHAAWTIADSAKSASGGSQMISIECRYHIQWHVYLHSAHTWCSTIVYECTLYYTVLHCTVLEVVLLELDLDCKE